MNPQQPRDPQRRPRDGGGSNVLANALPSHLVPVSEGVSALRSDLERYASLPHVSTSAHELLQRLMTDNVARQALSFPREHVEHLIIPRILNGELVRETPGLSAFSRDLPNGCLVVPFLDLPTGFIAITAKMLDTWKISANQAFEFAHRNLDSWGAEVTLRQVFASRPDIRVVVHSDGMAAKSSALLLTSKLHALLSRHLGAHDAFYAAAPARDFFAAAPADDPVAVVALRVIAKEFYSKLPMNICTKLFRVTADGIGQETEPEHFMKYSG